MEGGDKKRNSLQRVHEEDGICASMHNLCSISNHHHHRASTAGTLNPTAVKRQVPSSQSLIQEPSPKKACIYTPSEPDLRGFKKLALPAASPIYSTRTINPSSVLNRTVSDSAAAIHRAPPLPLARSLSFNATVSDAAAAVGGTPPLPLSRTSPSATGSDAAGAVVGTPPLPLSRTKSLTLQESPIVTVSDAAAAVVGTPPLPLSRTNSLQSTKRLKESLREMSQWANQLSNELEEEGESVESLNCCVVCEAKEASENDINVGDVPVEAVCVDKRDECLVLHFKCPCGEGYQILLSGNECYYKLSHF